MPDTFLGMPVRFDESLEPGEFYLAPPAPDPCGAYRHSPAGRKAPHGPWSGDRCMAPRQDDVALCEAHAAAAGVFDSVRERQPYLDPHALDGPAHFEWRTEPPEASVRIEWPSIKFDDVYDPDRHLQPKEQDVAHGSINPNQSAPRGPTDGLAPGRIVTYRSNTGNYDLAAIVTQTYGSTWQPGVAAGDVPPLTGKTNVHLRVFTPGEQGAYAEHDVPYDPDNDEPEPGSWRWPERS